MLKDLIDERVYYMYGDIDQARIKYIPDKSMNNYLDDSYMDAFEGIICRAAMFNIYSFDQIGLIDPYPDEQLDTNFAIPATDEDLVYRGTRYVEGNSPNVLYFPSGLMMMKLMRACIGVTDIEKLWFKESIIPKVPLPCDSLKEFETTDI
jgi:hypothetical protein